ncbi:MAG: flagellar biosynthesis protein FlhB [Thermomicrobium sp.]|nr:flagellar biosynthesis protein FlhB [Thermomicrobium sp.]MDW8059390.1 flagellar biosynthesis protein FlhB [Thermomicrobium sp.]
MASERTERATPRRRQEARKRGQVPRSADLTSALALLAGAFFLPWYAGSAAHTLWGYLQRSFTGPFPADLTAPDLVELAWTSGAVFLRLTLPMLGLFALVGVGSTLLQAGFVLAPAVLKPDLRRIDPIAGFQRLFSRRGLFETGKALVKIAIVLAITYPLVRRDLPRYADLTGAEPMLIARAIGTTIRDLAVRIGVAYLAIALVDYGFQRWDLEQRLRMTRHELKEELRQTEGDPEIKARIRRLQRQYAMQRMMAQVPRATVVVTNPTHLAVALRYEPGTMRAPVVVAKGAGTVAERITALARQHTIPVLRNQPLAQALYRTVEVGQEIPVTLYEAVADIIAYVYRLRRARAPIANAETTAGEAS